MDENNSKEVEKDLEKPNTTEENIENPEVKEEIKIEKNIERNIEKNIDKKKVVKEVEKRDRNGSKKDNGQVYVQYRKPSFFSSVLLLLIGALLATIAFLILYVFVIDKGEEVDIYKEPENEIEVVEEEKDKEQTEVKNLDLSLDGEFITSLYNKIPINYFAQEIYNYYRTTEAALTGNQKMLFALEKMREAKKYEDMQSDNVINRLEKTLDTSGNTIAEVQKFDIKEVEDYYKSVFGSDQKIIKEDIETNMGYVYEYDKQDDCFYGHYYAGGGGFGYAYKTTIDSVEKNDDNSEVYIYDYYIKTDYSMGEGPLKVYRYPSDFNSIGEESEKTYYIDEAKGKVFVKIEVLNKYKNNGLIKFKHTFKLDENGDYYWYSCEPLNNQ